MFDSLLELFERDGHSRSQRRPTGVRARLARLLHGDNRDHERDDDHTEHRRDVADRRHDHRRRERFDDE